MRTTDREPGGSTARRPAGWTARDIPDQSGRTVIVTGASSGVGEAAARELAGAGARVILAVRSLARGRKAVATMPGATELRRLELSDLASVRMFAAGIDGDVDVLINNAGIMAVPYGRTVDGFEMQLGTNHLGHFVLTGLMLRRIRDRVVTVSSLAHRRGRIRFDDLSFERGYHGMVAYEQSKLANLLFAYELRRRLQAAGSPVRSLAVHPGLSRTNLFGAAERTLGIRIMAFFQRFVAQSAERGALPLLYAATVDLPGGTYVGPGGFAELWGQPRIVQSSPASMDRRMAEALWSLSESLTGVRYDFTVT